MWTQCTPTAGASSMLAWEDVKRSSTFILQKHRAANASQTFSSILSSVRRRVEGGTPTYRIVLANEERTLVAEADNLEDANGDWSFLQDRIIPQVQMSSAYYEDSMSITAGLFFASNAFQSPPLRPIKGISPFVLRAWQILACTAYRKSEPFPSSLFWSATHKGDFFTFQRRVTLLPSAMFGGGGPLARIVANDPENHVIASSRDEAQLEAVWERIDSVLVAALSAPGLRPEGNWKALACTMAVQLFKFTVPFRHQISSQITAASPTEQPAKTSVPNLSSMPSMDQIPPNLRECLCTMFESEIRRTTGSEGVLSAQVDRARELLGLQKRKEEHASETSTAVRTSPAKATPTLSAATPKPADNTPIVAGSTEKDESKEQAAEGSVEGAQSAAEGCGKSEAPASADTAGGKPAVPAGTSGVPSEQDGEAGAAAAVGAEEKESSGGGGEKMGAGVDDRVDEGVKKEAEEVKKEGKKGQEEVEAIEREEEEGKVEVVSEGASRGMGGEQQRVGARVEKTEMLLPEETLKSVGWGMASFWGQSFGDAFEGGNRDAETPRAGDEEGLGSNSKSSRETLLRLEQGVREELLQVLVCLLCHKSHLQAHCSIALQGMAVALNLTPEKAAAWLDACRAMQPVCSDLNQAVEEVQEWEDERLIAESEVAEESGAPAQSGAGAGVRKAMMATSGLVVAAGGKVVSAIEKSTLASLTGIGASVSAASAGAGVASRAVFDRTATATAFSFRPLGAPSPNGRATALIAVSGWVAKDEEVVSQWAAALRGVATRERCALRCDLNRLQSLGAAMDVSPSSPAWTLISGAASGAKAVVQRAAGAAATDPWSVVYYRTELTASLLARVILRTPSRPLTLIGYGLGARVVFYALLKLAEFNIGEGVIDHCFLIGAPVASDEGEWAVVRSIVAGRLVNAFHTTDKSLQSGWQITYKGGAAGGSSQKLFGVENVDITGIVTKKTKSGHADYRECLPAVIASLNLT